MIWVAWRQFRTQALVTFGLLAAFAVLVLVTGLHLRDVYGSLGGAHCAARSDCTALSRPRQTVLADVLGPALLAIPALLGMFWGAPLVAREFESGTYRLAWTQSVTRRRWLSVRVALVGVAALIVAGLASWLVSWWFAPLDAVNMNRFDAERLHRTRDRRDRLRRLRVRARRRGRRADAPHAAGDGRDPARLHRGANRVHALGPPAPPRTPRTSWCPVTYGQGVGFSRAPSGVSVAPNVTPIPNAWILSTTLVDRARHALSAAQLHDLLVRACPTIAAGLPQRAGSPPKGPRGPASGPFLACEQRLSHHLQQLVTYQPPSHYWPLQALETAIFLAAAVALIAVAIWRVGPRAARRPAAGGPAQ